jgi:hypothetical protein
MNLRAVCLMVTILIGIPTSTASAIEMGAGVKLGLNLSRIWGEDDYNYDMLMLPGFVAGGMFQLKLSKSFAIQTEVLFTMKGVTYKWVDTAITGATYNWADTAFFLDKVIQTHKHQLSLRYLEIPVLMQFSIPVNDAFTPVVYAGPAFGIKLGIGHRSETDGKERGISKDYIKSINKSTETFDIGLAVGSSFVIQAGPDKVVLDIRYTLGFRNTRKLTDEMKNQGMKLDTERNMSLSFIIGYMVEF